MNGTTLLIKECYVNTEVRVGLWVGRGSRFSICGREDIKSYGASEIVWSPNLKEAATDQF